MKITEIDYSDEDVRYTDGKYIWKVRNNSLVLSSDTENYSSVSRGKKGFTIAAYYTLKDLVNLELTKLVYRQNKVRILCPDCNGKCLSFAQTCSTCNDTGFIRDYEVDNLLAIGRATVLAYSKGLKFRSDIVELRNVRSLLNWSNVGERKYLQISDDYLDEGDD